MCTTYTWLAYQWPERRQASTGAAGAGAPPHAMPPCIREEDEEEHAGAGPRAGRPRPPWRQRRSARHCVGLAIVGVQMAAWCLVGALLMHRGVVNLKRRDAAAASSTTASSVWTLQHHHDGAGMSTTTAAAWTEPVDDDGGVLTVTVDPDEDPDDDDDTEGDAAEDSARDVLKRGWSSFLPMQPPPRPPSWSAPAPVGEVLGGGAGTTKTASTGAATAVVMVTVGGVMLVVGPAFMMLKIMDVYQRQKRLAKQQQHEDSPPSYDEVAEKAPRYSALFQVLENGELSVVGAPSGTSVPPSGTSGTPSSAPEESSRMLCTESEVEEEEADADAAGAEEDARGTPTRSC